MENIDKINQVKNNINKLISIIFYTFVLIFDIKLLLLNVNLISIIITLLFTFFIIGAFKYCDKVFYKRLYTFISFSIVIAYLTTINMQLQDIIILSFLIPAILLVIFYNKYFAILGNTITLFLLFFIFKDLYKENLFEIFFFSMIISSFLLSILAKLVEIVFKHIEYLLTINIDYDKLAQINNHNMFLPNRKYALKKLSENMQSNKEFSVAVIDLDKLKTINNSIGYDAGDYIIYEVANRIKKIIGNTHIAVRSGGDEFTIIINNIKNKKECIKIISDILINLRKSFIYNNNILHISASIGVVFSDQKFNSIDEYISAANISLMKAKDMGYDRICIFDTLKDEDKIRKFKIENDLKVALDNNQFELYYQPIIQLSSKEIVGLEALIRWNHPQFGIVSPLEFIPIAESTGIINNIGYFIINEACKKLSEINIKFNVSKKFAMNINISPKQLKNSLFYEELLKSILQNNVNPNNIHIEITETALIDDIESCKIILNKIGELGVKIHLDDFGTGYSSLSYIHKLPIDSLKIDKSFIDNMLNEHKNFQLIKSIILMSKELNMNVVAEGIEDIVHYNKLLDLGCDFGQGYYFSKPLKNNDLILLLEQVNFLKDAV